MIFYDNKQVVQYLDGFIGKTIGVTSGCFDLLHPLHVLYLQKCRRFCDILLVQIDSDQLSLVNKKKIPRINELDRAYMVDSLKFVDCTQVINSLFDISEVLNGTDKELNTIVCFKNSNSIYGIPAIEIDGVELIIIPDVQRFNSTTEIIKHALDTECPGGSSQ